MSSKKETVKVLNDLMKTYRRLRTEDDRWSFVNNASSDKSILKNLLDLLAKKEQQWKLLNLEREDEPLQQEIDAESPDVSDKHNILKAFTPDKPDALGIPETPTRKVKSNRRMHFNNIAGSLNMNEGKEMKTMKPKLLKLNNKEQRPDLNSESSGSIRHHSGSSSEVSYLATESSSGVTEENDLIKTMKRKNEDGGSKQFFKTHTGKELKSLQRKNIKQGHDFGEAHDTPLKTGTVKKNRRLFYNNCSPRFSGKEAAVLNNTDIADIGEGKSFEEAHGTYPNMTKQISETVKKNLFLRFYCTSEISDSENQGACAVKENDFLRYDYPSPEFSGSKRQETQAVKKNVFLRYDYSEFSDLNSKRTKPETIKEYTFLRYDYSSGEFSVSGQCSSNSESKFDKSCQKITQIDWETDSMKTESQPKKKPVAQKESARKQNVKHAARKTAEQRDTHVARKTKFRGSLKNKSETV